MKSPTNNNRKAAVTIGRTFLQAQLAAENPQMAADKLKTQFADRWNASRQAYVKLGNTVLRRLERAGYVVTPAPGSAPRAPGKAKA